MDIGLTERAKPLVAAVRRYLEEEIIPREAAFEAELDSGGRWHLTDRQLQILGELKAGAKAQGLWNFWLTDSERGHGLTTVEYAYLAEVMGWSKLAAESFNCSAPDTGNMEVLERYGSEAQKRAWLDDLLEGRIRSAYLMTEPGVASSDATNIALEARRDGEGWVLNGEKWWASGAGDPRCQVYIVMALTDPEAPKHQRHSQFLLPAGTPGVEILRPMTVFGHDDAPHGHMHVRLTDVRLPDGNGLDLLAHAGRSESYPPVIIMTGYADVELSVRAMRDGAADFLTKPLREQDLLDAVTAALAVDQQRWFQRRESQRLRRCFDSLSERQRQVIELVANGRLNKQAAAELDLSETTVKTHRRLAMQKMQARGTADLVRMAVQLGLSGCARGCGSGVEGQPASQIGGALGHLSRSGSMDRSQPAERFSLMA